MKKTLALTVGLALAVTMSACSPSGSATPEPSDATPSAAAISSESVLGVVVALVVGDDPSITLLVDGEPQSFPIDPALAETVEADWDSYSHWGMYLATTEAGVVDSLEYGDGVDDILGIFADKESGKTLADVLSLSGTTVTLTSAANLLDSDDPEELPGFSTENPDLTATDGTSFDVASDAIVYVEGTTGVFEIGTLELVTDAAYDYVEFYDVDGDGVYDQVIVWLI